MNFRKLYEFILVSLVTVSAFSVVDTYDVKASNNNITVNEIDHNTYYGQKAIGYYGFKHAGGFWKINRKLDHGMVMEHDFFGFWQAGNGAGYKLKGKYVHFNQSLLMTKKKPLIVKKETIVGYVNNHGGRLMLRNIKTIGTKHQMMELSKLYN